MNHFHVVTPVAEFSSSSLLSAMTWARGELLDGAQTIKVTACASETCEQGMPTQWSEGR